MQNRFSRLDTKNTKKEVDLNDLSSAAAEATSCHMQICVKSCSCAYLHAKTICKFQFTRPTTPGVEVTFSLSCGCQMSEEKVLR